MIFLAPLIGGLVSMASGAAATATAAAATTAATVGGIRWKWAGFFPGSLLIHNEGRLCPKDKGTKNEKTSHKVLVGQKALRYLRRNCPILGCRFNFYKSDLRCFVILYGNYSLNNSLPCIEFYNSWGLKLEIELYSHILFVVRCNHVVSGGDSLFVCVRCDWVSERELKLFCDVIAYK